MDESEVAAIVEREFQNAMGAQGSEIAKERAQAWDYYLSKPFGNEIEGLSKIVTSDVSDVIDGMMPSILRIFTVSDNLITFDPVDSDDVEQAQQESDYVNYVFFKKNDAFIILYTWFFDALLQKNGIVKAWWDESEVVTRETYQDLSEADLAQLLDDDELEAVEREEKTVSVGEDPVTGEELEITTHDVVFERTSKAGQARVMPVPPEEYRISADSRTLNPSESRFVGHERDIPRSELIEMGFDRRVVEDLPSTLDVADTEEGIARYDRTDESRTTPGSDKSQDLIKVQEAYIRLDMDDDGRSELRQIFKAGNEILSNEEIDRQPFHVVSPQPLPHKHFGRASSDKVKDVQKIQSTLVRQIMDNLYHTNNPEKAVWEQAITENTLSDLLSTRVGKINRFGRPVTEAFAPMTVPFTAGDSFPMVEYWDKVKRDRTGIVAEGEGLDPEQLKNIQSHVLSQASELSRMKIEAVVRIFAETGVKSLFLHIHELLQKHQRKEEIIKLRGEFVPVNPQEWRTRKNMTVQIGLGIGTKEQNLLHLTDLWQKQLEAVQAGATGMVTPREMFNTGMEIAKNANLKTPERFWSDPGENGFQQQAQEQQAQMQQQQQELIQLQVQIKEREMEIQAREQEVDREKNHLNHQRETEKIQIEREKVDNDMQIKLEEIANKLTEMELKFNQNVPGAKV